MDHQEKDETAVAYLATAMNTKLARARAKGRSGWGSPECTQLHLSNLLREHVEKGDPVDVANFCAFLAARGEGIAPRQCLAHLPAVLEQIAQGWDGCKYDAPGETLDIGADIRAAAKRLLAEQPAAMAGPTWGEQQVHALAIHMAASAPPSHKPRDYDADMAWAHSALGFIAGHAPAAPALEAPAAPAGKPLAVTPEMRSAFRRAYREGSLWNDRLDYALDQMLAAAPQALRLSEDALHLLRRLLSNQYTLTGAEFRAELEKIVAEESARHAAAPQAPAAPCDKQSSPLQTKELS